MENASAPGEITSASCGSRNQFMKACPTSIWW